MSEANKDMKALYKIGYGLYVVTSHDGKRDNGLIVNTVMQVTSSPERVAVAINKSNYSHDVIRKTGKMNVNTLTIDAPFKVFEAFGFRSGRDTNKFEGCSPSRTENGLALLPRYINSYMSLRVESYIDLGSHGMFICSVSEAAVVSDAETMTYSHYHANVKPKPAPVSKDEGGVKKYVCQICGYIHEGDMPDDFECPICKHGKEDFEEVK